MSFIKLRLIYHGKEKKSRNEKSGYIQKKRPFH